MSNTKSMTYAELADALGIGLDSAKNLVRRKQWPRTRGNDGMARITVPIEAVPLPPANPPTDTPINPPTYGATDAPTTPLILEVLQRHIERLESELATLRVERDEERVRAADLALKAGQVEALTATLKAVEGERDRWHQVATAPRGWMRIFRRA